MITNLASLLSPADERSFFEHFASKSRIHVQSGDSRRVESLLPWDTINRLLESEALSPSRLKLVRANTVIPPMMYRGGDEANPINPRALQTLLPQGVSIVIDGIEDYVPQLGRLSDSIERRLARRVWINSYLSFGRGKAFKPHWDNHDVIVVQVYGSKRWRSFGVPDPPPMRKHREGDPVPARVEWEGMLHAGDLLYLPRGEVHEAELETADSVHLTIGIKPRRGTEMRAQIDSANLAAFPDNDDTRARPERRINLGIIDRIANDTLVVPALRRKLELEMTSPEVEDVMIGGERFSLSAIARRVLDLLATADSQPLASIVAALDTHADGTKIRDAVRDLARFGLVGLESQDSR